MRVALFTETFLPKVDGIVTVVCLLLDHLAKRGVESVIVSPRLGKIERYANTRVVTVPSLSLPWYPEVKIGAPTIYEYQELKDFKPDVAHFIHPVTVGLPGMVMAKQLGIPIVTSFHLDFSRLAHHYHVGFLEPLINIATRIVFNSADYSLAPSRLIQREMQAVGVKEVGLWGRGVDAEKFNPRYRDLDMRHELTDGHPDDVILIYVGRLGNEKQIDHLRPILENVPGTRLALVGDGPSRDYLEKHFAGLPVKFMGYLQGETLSRAYASADIFVFPSALETFGLVVVEAMAAGLPVVASRVGGVRDVVKEGETGYTFEVGDIDALVDGVRRIVNNRDNIAVMGKTARAFAETQTWYTMMEEVITLYQHLIDENKKNNR